MNSITYPYLSDLRFLKELDELNIKEQFVKIIVLDWLENPIANIEGRVSGGSMNLDGASAVRRSGSITFICDDEYYNVLDVNNLISINKKIKIEIGYANTTDKYTEYDKIWFPQGVFVIINPSITHNNQGLSIAISFKDKMCLLNGECGGVLPASVTFHEREEEDGTITRVTYYQIIRELVSEFGGEQLGKIIINDVDTKIKKVMKWVGDESITLTLVTPPETAGGTSISKENECQPQEDIGYIYTDFCPTSDLVGNAGQNVVTILDNIKKQLGNYEYFYDIDGNFIFQEIRNYLNTSQSTNEFQSIQYTPDGYLFQPNASKSVYSFKDSSVITAYQNTPQFANIKNDYIVWGTRESASGAKLPIRYHLALDTKPAVGNTYGCITQTDDFGYESVTSVIQKTAMGNAAEKKGQRVGRPSALYHQTQDDIKTYYQFKAALVGKSSSFTETDEHFIFSFDNIPLSQEKWYLLEFHEWYGKDYSDLPSGNELTTEKTDLLPRITTDSGSRPKLIAGKYDASIPVGQQAYIEPEEMCFYFDNTIQKRNSLQAVKLAKVNTDKLSLSLFNSASYVTVYSFDTVEDWRKIGAGNNYKIITTQDYRTELYLQGVMAETLGENKNRYYTELASEWPKLFKLEEKPEPDSTSAPVMLKAASPRASTVQITLDYDFKINEEDKKNYSITIPRTVGQPYGILPSIRRKGLKIEKWILEKEDKEIEIFPSTLVADDGNYTLKAIWTAFSYGDCNSDEKINAKDAVLLAQYLANWGVKIDEDAADCNGDGAINAKDAVLLAQYLANWGVSFGPSDKPISWTTENCIITASDLKWGAANTVDNNIELQFDSKYLNDVKFNFFLISFEILQGACTASEEWIADEKLFSRQWSSLTNPISLPGALEVMVDKDELTIIKLLAVEGVNRKTSTIYSFDPNKLPTISNQEYYTVALESGSSEAKQILYCTEGSSIELPVLSSDNEEKEFIGWHDEDGVLVNNLYTPSKNVTLTGQWKSNYRISIQTVLGGPMIEKAVVLGELYSKYLDFSPIRKGYEFDGWYFTDDTKITLERVIKKEDFPTENSTLTIKAKWKNILTITFDTQGGSPQLRSIKQPYSGSGYTYQIPDYGLSNAGYTFKGWYGSDGRRYDPEGLITPSDDQSYSIKLTAIWEAKSIYVIDVPVATDLSGLDLDYYLDLIDVQSKISEFNIPSIGVRSKVWSDNAVNCIFEKTPPNIILIEAGRGKATQNERDYCENQGDSYYQVPSSIYNALAGGGYQNSAFNAIRDVLYQYTNYNESITLTALPIYYLEPNTRITVEDEKSSIHGDYMIKSISRPFDCNGTMQITATKALERF